MSGSSSENEADHLTNWMELIKEYNGEKMNVLISGYVRENGLNPLSVPIVIQRLCAIYGGIATAMIKKQSAKIMHKNNIITIKPGLFRLNFNSVLFGEIMNNDLLLMQIINLPPKQSENDYLSFGIVKRPYDWNRFHRSDTLNNVDYFYGINLNGTISMGVNTTKYKKRFVEGDLIGMRFIKNALYIYHNDCSYIAAIIHTANNNRYSWLITMRGDVSLKLIKWK